MNLFNKEWLRDEDEIGVVGTSTRDDGVKYL